MEIPVVIHKDNESVYGVTVPDIPGCFSWGDTIDGALRNAREAIFGHLGVMIEEGMPICIQRSRIEALANNDGYRGGIWALVDVDLSALDSKPERINISIPRFVLKRIDAFAAARHETRSGVLARAALNLIAAESRASEPA